VLQHHVYAGLDLGLERLVLGFEVNKRDVHGLEW
jgi:hypothetical protein